MKRALLSSGAVLTNALNEERARSEMDNEKKGNQYFNLLNLGS
jgi:hypothetical protein